MGMLVGFDGGWTKTALALCSADGQLLARVRGPGTAVVGLPAVTFFDVADALLARLCETAGVRRSRIAHVVMGLSGVDFEDERIAQHAAISHGLGLESSQLSLVNDGVAALCGASRADRALIVQHGSGITLAWRKASGEERIYDSLDVGSVFDIRREAVIRVARMIDGRAEPTSLMERLLQHCEVPAHQFVEWVWREPEAKVRQATAAAVVFDAWRAGDSAAADLVQRAAADYVLAAAAMGDRLGQDQAFDVAFGGGVIAQGGVELQHMLSQMLASRCPLARWTPVALPPEAGALVLAAHRTGFDSRRSFDRLAEQWSAMNAQEATEFSTCES